MEQRVGTCSICGGEVRGFRSPWGSVNPPPPDTCSSCGAVAARDVIEMKHPGGGNWTSAGKGSVSDMDKYGRVEKKAPERILHNQHHYIPIRECDDPEVEEVRIRVEVSENDCPLCGKTWTSVHLNDQVVYGGMATKITSKAITEMCSACSVKDLTR